MSALALDFGYDETEARPRPVRAVAAPAPRALRADEGVEAVPRLRRRLYAVRGTVGEPRARAATAPTLDVVLGGAWSALASGFTACPVCHAETMTARWSAGHRLAGGRCAGCGTTLD